MPHTSGNQFTSMLRELYKKYNFIYKANPGNAGDGVIAAATYDYLEANGFVYSPFSASATYSPEKDVLLFGGGGNLIEGYYAEGRDFIKNHLGTFAKVIIFPSTIFGYTEFFKENIKHLFVCCREKTSYDRLLKLGYIPGESLLLTQDMAFYLDKEKYISEVIPTKGTASCYRTDSESLTKLQRENNHDISLTWNGDYWDNANLARNSTRSLISFLQEYKAVNTDRLHVAILGSLLGMEVNFYPNSYYKNESVYDHSLMNYYPNTYFIK
ncbi:polysaccharide pyruvyl transferase family protein [Serratia rhizosphaerae]|uniref:polysaccharide pyruvyl transferase family protein n=1 Tax=Serratia sp. Tan611 TaxID=2773264 RepID=UPI001933A74C|nr:polysaccharide pyruvyl transferase family protein [Serratia sp. Tan611]MBU3891551.1 polysaccharide pyruvyl transferase family protein [Serratia rubidaea]CAE1144413.1 PS_pyruv_trans domain-containing protein [Serratia sp. Tan611]